MTRTSPARIVLYVISALVLVYLILPVLIIAPISFSSARFLTFPPPSFSLRWYQQYFANPAWMQATRVTLTVALTALPSAVDGGTVIDADGGSLTGRTVTFTVAEAQSDGVYGLRRALVMAGAETEVMSLWKVADQPTRDLNAGRDVDLL